MATTSRPRKLLIVWPSPERYVARLALEFPDVQIASAHDFDAARAHLEDAEILLTHGVGLTTGVALQMTQLRWIQCLISGTDQLIDARTARPDVLLTSCRGIHGPQMGEMALLHMLALSRGLIRSERGRVVHELPVSEQRVLEQKTVVIVGMGVAGTRLASVCKALEMTVYGVSRTDREIDGVDRMFDREQLTAAAAAADYLVLALPHDSDSHELIDAEVLAAMKPTAFLVNIARGAVVDEQALVAALETGALAGAGLDVTAPEPPARDSPLWRLDNVVLTPHIAGRSDRYDEHALEVVIPNVGRYLNGERDLLNVISDPDVVASSQP